MRKLSLFLGLGLLLCPLTVQPVEYLINPDLGGMSGSVETPIIALTAGDWDDGYYDLPLPAANQFYFYGKKVTDLRIFTNGLVVLGFGAPPTTSSYFPSNSSIPNPVDNPHGFIAPWWEDWIILGGGGLGYTISSDIIYIEWTDVGRWPYAGSSYSFAVAICVNFPGWPAAPFTKNDILFMYYDCDSGLPEYDYGAGGTVGIEHYDGTQGAQFSYNTASLAMGRTYHFLPFEPAYDSTNFNPGGRTDIMIYRPSQGVWKINDPLAGVTQTIYFGSQYDVPLPGDFDGDGAADPCIFRPSEGRWRVQGPDMSVNFGTHGDIPVPADYNGDGMTDIAIFRPWQGIWRIRYTGTGTQVTVYFGQGGDIPVPYDYDGDLKADIAIVRPGANLLWRIQYSLGGSGSFYYGLEGDIPVPGDWDSNPRIAIWRPSDGKWRIKDVAASWATFTWGVSGDVALPGDFDGGGYTDWAIWRPAQGMWRIATDTTTNYTYYWGQIGDIPRFRRSGAVRAVGSITENGTNSRNRIDSSRG
jgi:hypothetical protein